MAAKSKSWEQVGERFESLGTHLRGHFDEVSADASTERAAFERSVRGLLSALEDGFTAARKVVRDPTLRQDVTDVAVSVREALLATFEGAGEQVRERLARPARRARPAAKRAPAARKTTTGRTAAARKATARKTTARTTAKATPRRRTSG